MKMQKKIIAFLCSLLFLSGYGATEAATSRELNATPIPNNWRYRHKTFGDYGTALPRLKITTVDSGGTLIFSDSPEYVEEDGILYQDTVSGEARVLYYHLNNTTQRKKVAVVLENKENKPVTVTVKRSGDGRPNAEMYCVLGKETQTAYFRQPVRQTIELAAGEKKLLQEFMNRRIVKPQELVYGVYDFSVGGSVKVSVISYPTNVDPVKFLDGARVLPADELHLRGTFPKMDRLITLSQPYDVDKDGAACITLSDDINDLYRKGIDATDGSEVVNQGNYGINYWLDIPTVGRGKTRYLLVPTGGVYAGALRVHVDKTAEMIPTPSDTIWFADGSLPPAEDEVEDIALGLGFEMMFPMSPQTMLGEFDNGRRLLFEYSPPGASNLPVNIVLLPVK